MALDDDVDHTVREEEPFEIIEGRLVTTGPGEPRAFPIGTGVFRIGRNVHCSFVVSDPKVSAIHCELRATPRGVHLKDCSRNGTHLDRDNLVLEAFLRSPTWIRVGDTHLRFEPDRPRQVHLPEDKVFGRLLGASQVMRDLFRRLRKLAATDLSVILFGETGTGKELAAEAIHKASPRAGGPFIVVDCGAIPAGLADSFLFGHKRGAFTGAISHRISPFIEASGGTLFLDELGELPLEIQPKLLRALAERRVKAVGSNDYVGVDVRVIAATRCDITRAINEKRFRDDLYFRLAQEEIVLPPLRARKDDIRLIVRHMLDALVNEDAFDRIAPGVLDRLDAFDWPGNVRQLRNVVETAAAYDEGGPLDITVRASAAQSMTGDLSSNYKTYEWALSRKYFSNLIEETDRNITTMAQRAGMDRSSVRRQLERLELSRGREEQEDRGEG